MSQSMSFGSIVTSGNDDTRFGIIAELRKTDCRVFYPDVGSSTWTNLSDLRPCQPEETDGTLESRITTLLTMLGAIELEFQTLEPGRCLLIATHRAITPETIDRVRSTLGKHLLNYALRPAGLHRIQTILEFRFP